MQTAIIGIAFFSLIQLSSTHSVYVWILQQAFSFSILGTRYMSKWWSMVIPQILHIQKKFKKTRKPMFSSLVYLLADLWERDLVELVLEVAVSQVSHRQRDMLLRQVAVLLGVLDSDIIVREISAFNEHRSVLTPRMNNTVWLPSCFDAIASNSLYMALWAFHIYTFLAISFNNFSEQDIAGGLKSYWHYPGFHLLKCFLRSSQCWVNKMILHVC